MKKQTPIQKLIDKLNGLARFIGEADATEDKYYRDGLREAIEEAESLLEEEKKLLEGVYLKGLNKGVAFERHQQTESYPCEWPSDVSFEELIDIERDNE